jgi:hypothetical protein
MNTKSNLITAAEDDLFGSFKNDKERIKYISRAYKNINIAKSFAIFYNEEVSQEVKQNRNINTITTIKIGDCYVGEVKDFDSNQLTFAIPGVKEELIAKDNFNSCFSNVENYLLTHENKLLFQVREKRDNKYYVSVVDAYYKLWKTQIDAAIMHEDTIDVHIDSLVNGGYVCHTDIVPINELTGKKYISSVFIPGSHIVLNIEHDFEKWVDKDVKIIPQKFVEYRRDFKTGTVDNSLVGSRKRLLQIVGMNNMYEIYNRYKLSQVEGVKSVPEVFEGVVTGIINSNKKTGVFVELPDLSITGLMPIDASELLDYKPGDDIKVTVKEFEVQDGKEPFITKKKGTKVIKCNVRPVFAKA